MHPIRSLWLKQWARRHGWEELAASPFRSSQSLTHLAGPGVTDCVTECTSALLQKTAAWWESSMSLPHITQRLPSSSVLHNLFSFVASDLAATLQPKMRTLGRTLVFQRWYSPLSARHLVHWWSSLGSHPFQIWRAFNEGRGDLEIGVIRVIGNRCETDVCHQN
jgi:hypothetical protein